jgi:hypothetical protein
MAYKDAAIWGYLAAKKSDFFYNPFGIPDGSLEESI